MMSMPSFFEHGKKIKCKWKRSAGSHFGYSECDRKMYNNSMLAAVNNEDTGKYIAILELERRYVQMDKGRVNGR